MSRICLAVENALHEEGIYPLGGFLFHPIMLPPLTRADGYNRYKYLIVCQTKSTGNSYV